MSADSNAQPNDVSGLVAALGDSNGLARQRRVRRWSISANRLCLPLEPR